MAELPQNWQKEYLTNICNVYQPKTISTKELLADGSYPVYGANGQIGYYDKYNHEFSEVLITCRGATCGNINKSVPKSWINGNAMVASPISNAILDKNYLFYYLKNTSFADYISGTAQPQITRTSLTKMPVIYPPLNEQKRIVEKLDKIIRIVDGVNARLDKIPTALKRARQSILNQAITGELTKDWREKNLDIIPASIMIEHFKQLLLESSSKNERDNINNIFSYKENYFSFGIPHTWTFSILKKLCKSFKYGTSTKSESSGLVTVLRMGNIQKGEIDWNDLVYTSDSKEIEKYKLEKNDVLFNRTNSPELVGKTAIYRGERAAIYAGYLIKIENYKILNSEYLNYALNSTFAKEWKLDVKTDGVSQSNINAQKLAKFEVPLPPLEEQAEIVRRVKLAFEKLDKIESRYQKAKEYSDKLTQSILNKAFRGELVPQDPNDKPISLDEIQAQIVEKPSKKRKTLKNNKVQEMVKEIIEILKEYPEGISPEELFKNSKYSQKDFTDDDIIEFYKELSNLLDSKLTEEKNSVNHKILIKKVK